MHTRQHSCSFVHKSLIMQLLWSVLGVAFLASCVAAEGYRVVCYYGSWAVYRPGDGKYDVENIDPTLCTHLVYTFENVRDDGSVIIYDSWNDIDKGALKRFIKLREKSPSTKIMVAIGGWNAGSYTFSQVVNSPTLRAKFADSIVEFVLKWGFDGFDVDWEYPAQRGGQPSDKEALIELLKLLRPKFDEHKLLLSAALSAGVTSVDTSYDVPGLNKYLDFLNVMAYDLHGSWERFTGENAPLYAGPADQSELQKTLNVDYAVKYWIKKGATPSKINLGMGTYGRSFTLASAAKSSVGAETYGPGEAGPYTREGGTLGYNEICDFIKQGKWTEHWNEPQQVPYATSGTQWVGYDNIKSIKLKSQYVKDNGLGGAMIWSVETDDFHGKCGNGENPLLHAINEVLTGDRPNPPPTPKPSHTTSHSGEDTQSPKTEPPVTEPPVTEPPVTQPPPPPKGICTKDGFVRDPNNCAVFYQCVNQNGQYQAFRYECASGTVFDPSINGCNYQTSVKC